MSVHLAEVATSEGLMPEDLLPAEPVNGFGMICLSVGLLYNCEQVVLPDAMIDDASHALVVGNKTTGRKKQWSREATVLIVPDVP